MPQNKLGVHQKRNTSVDFNQTVDPCFESKGEGCVFCTGVMFWWFAETDFLLQHAPYLLSTSPWGTEQCCPCTPDSPPIPAPISCDHTPAPGP